MSYGATQKGYRLNDIEHIKAIYSRYIVFDEIFIPEIQKETTGK